MVSYPMRPPFGFCYCLSYYTTLEAEVPRFSFAPKETALGETRPSRRPNTRQSKNQYPPVARSSDWRVLGGRLAGIRQISRRPCVFPCAYGEGIGIPTGEG